MWNCSWSLSFVHLLYLLKGNWAVLYQNTFQVLSTMELKLRTLHVHAQVPNDWAPTAQIICVINAHFTARACLAFLFVVLPILDTVHKDPKDGSAQPLYENIWSCSSAPELISIHSI